MRENLQELQLDALPGPTHHFGALSYGNVASMKHQGWESNPRLAALQSLEKMRRVSELGLLQAVLPPLERPDMQFLRSLGFTGNDRTLLAQAAHAESQLLGVAMSSAFMWTANLATVIPSTDARDRACHLVVANLTAMPHRALESSARTAMLKKLFPTSERLVIHPPLPAVSLLSDEGAANHTRLAAMGGRQVCHLFVYGRSQESHARALPRRFPARQTYEASRAVSRLSQIPTERALFVQQSPHAIDAGAFHNDVVMVGDGDRVLLHEHSWRRQKAVLAELRRRLPELKVWEVKERELSLGQAVQSYLFNSQLLTTQAGHVLLAPAQSRDRKPAQVIRRLVDDGFVSRVVFQELDQSMAGGGGPACLRLRVPLSKEELAGIARGIVLTPEKIERLEAWARRYYRDRLTARDLADPKLLEESRRALDNLTPILDLGSLYPFQRNKS